jgi:hypothetical protein
MTTVTGYTAEKMEEILATQIVGAHLDGDHLILEKQGGGTIDVGSVRGDPGPTGASPLVVTSTTRPTTFPDLFEGLMIYETDTGKTYIYNGSTWINILTKLPKDYASRQPTSPDSFFITSTTGEDWYPAHPFDVTFSKLLGATDSYLYLRIHTGGYTDVGVTGWASFAAGVKISGVSYWWATSHQVDLNHSHAQVTAPLKIFGISDGPLTMRAVMKKVAPGNDIKVDVADPFIIEYEEVPI